MFILTMQYSLGISPEFRSNFDYIFLLGEDFKNNQKKLHDHYAGMFQSLKAFIDVFQQITADYGTMVIVNRGAREDFLEKVFWYKAEYNVDISHMGCKQFRLIDKWNFDPLWKDKKYNLDVEDYMNKKIKSRSKIKINMLDGQLK